MQHQPDLAFLSEQDRDILERYGWFANDDKMIESLELPDLTIGILTYNRRDDLRMVLTMLTYFDKYPNKHIIVVDNASTDGTDELIKEYFPKVEYHKLDKNTGTAGRNIAVKHARTPYFFSLDDDSLPSTPTTLIECVQFLESHPEISVVSTSYYQPRNDINETALFHTCGTKIESDKPEWYKGWYLLEGGCCGRTSDIQRYGLYDESGDFWGADGVDVQLSLYRAKCIMAYLPSVLTLHFKQWAGRSPIINTYRQCKNLPKLYAKNFTPIVAYFLLTLMILRKMLSAVMYPSRTKSIALGFAHGLKEMYSFSPVKYRFGIKHLSELRLWLIGLLRWS
jgi:GT2 family glycosyltransferase